MPMAAGALITDDAISGAPGTPIAMYAASTEPATDAKPPAITQCSSEGVIDARSGRTSSGASVIPRKTLAVAQTASEREQPRRRRSAPPTWRKPTCSSPRYMSTWQIAEKKMVTGSAEKTMLEPTTSSPKQKSAPTRA